MVRKLVPILFLLLLSIPASVRAAGLQINTGSFHFDTSGVGAYRLYLMSAETASTAPTCGNLVCDAGEDADVCPVDCPSNSLCEGGAPDGACDCHSEMWTMSILNCTTEGIALGYCLEGQESGVTHGERGSCSDCYEKGSRNQGGVFSEGSMVHGPREGFLFCALCDERRPGLADTYRGGETIEYSVNDSAGGRLYGGTVECLPCDNNGECEGGEWSHTCPNDCPLTDVPHVPLAEELGTLVKQLADVVVVEERPLEPVAEGCNNNCTCDSGESEEDCLDCIDTDGDAKADAIDVFMQQLADSKVKEIVRFPSSESLANFASVKGLDLKGVKGFAKGVKGPKMMLSSSQAKALAVSSEKLSKSLKTGFKIAKMTACDPCDKEYDPGSLSAELCEEWADDSTEIPLCGDEDKQTEGLLDRIFLPGASGASCLERFSVEDGPDKDHPFFKLGNRLYLLSDTDLRRIEAGLDELWNSLSEEDRAAVLRFGGVEEFVISREGVKNLLCHLAADYRGEEVKEIFCTDEPPLECDSEKKPECPTEAKPTETKRTIESAATLPTSVVRPCLLRTSVPACDNGEWKCVDRLEIDPSCGKREKECEDKNDTDRDGIGDLCDNCPEHRNPIQENRDKDLFGDACDFDDEDEDGQCDTCCVSCCCQGGGCAPQSCYVTDSTTGRDPDGDGLDNFKMIYGVACDICPEGPNTHSDKDLVPDPCDNCPFHFNAQQRDSDGDGIGDVCDHCPNVPDPSNPEADVGCPAKDGDDNKDDEEDAQNEGTPTCPEGQRPDEKGQCVDTAALTGKPPDKAAEKLDESGGCSLHIPR